MTFSKHTYASFFIAKTLEIESQTSGKHAETNFIFTRKDTFLPVNVMFSHVSVVLLCRKHTKELGSVVFSDVYACCESTDVHTFHMHAFTIIRARVYYTFDSQRKGDLSIRKRVSSCGSI